MLPFIFLLLIKGCMLGVENNYIESPPRQDELRHIELNQNRQRQEGLRQRVEEIQINREKEKIYNSLRQLTKEFLSSLSKKLDNSILYMFKCGLTRYIEAYILSYNGDLQSFESFKEQYQRCLKSLKTLINGVKTSKKDSRTKATIIVTILQKDYPSTFQIVSKSCSCLTFDNPLWLNRTLIERINLLEPEISYLSSYLFAKTILGHLLSKTDKRNTRADVDTIHQLVIELHSPENDFVDIVKDQILQKYLLYISLRMLNSLADLSSHDLVGQFIRYCNSNGGAWQCRKILCVPNSDNLREKLQRFAVLDQLLFNFCQRHSPEYYLFPQDSPKIFPPSKHRMVLLPEQEQQNIEAVSD